MDGIFIMGMFEKIHGFLEVSQNPDNPARDFNPDLALELLKEAGWTKNLGINYCRKMGMLPISFISIQVGTNF